MRIQILALCAAMLAPFAANADANKTAKLGDPEMHVLAHVHHANQMEVTAGKLAQKRATRDSIKSYGTMLVKDHGQNDRDILAFAKKHGQKIGDDMPMTDDEKASAKKGKDAMDSLKAAKGADFDREFLTMMAADHDQELAKLDMAVHEISDPDLKAMLRDMKPVLQKHADQAHDLEKADAQASLDEK